MNKKILKLLYRSFDDELKDKEKKQLAEALQRSEALRREKESIISQRKAIFESSERSFKPFFAERVISNIQSAKGANGFIAFYESLKLLFRRLVIVGAVVLIVLISFNLAKDDSLSMEEVFYTSDVTFEKILDLPLF
jgi:hypothetical protein